MSIIHEIKTNHWDTTFPFHKQKEAINALESGSILLMPQLAFILSPHEKELLSPAYTNPKMKQISLEPKSNTLSGTQCSARHHEVIKNMMYRFSQNAHQIVHELLSPYKHHIKTGRTSFRSIEVKGRVTSYRKDDTRLHVDAFPSAPTQGLRILRIFTNINQDGVDRVWRAGEPFNNVAAKFLPNIRKSFPHSATILKALKITKSYRTEYDHIMLQIHDKMKADLDYQKNVIQCELRFAPNTSWIVQTDHVSHAAMSGQFLLEQTFYLPVNAMANPNLSPLRILENMLGKKLV